MPASRLAVTQEPVQELQGVHRTSSIGQHEARRSDSARRTKAALHVGAFERRALRLKACMAGHVPRLQPEKCGLEEHRVQQERLDGQAARLCRPGVVRRQIPHEL